MTPSELGFIKGLVLSVLICFIIKHLCSIIFNITLTEKDKLTLDKCRNIEEPYPDNIKIALHTMILCCIIYTMGLIIFFNSAMILAIVLRSYL
jgi:hypothetical protein